jgi:hypothetical protein
MLERHMYKTIIPLSIVIVIPAAFLFGGYYGLQHLATLFPPSGSAPTTPANLESYLKLAGIGLTLLASVMTAFIALVNVVMQVLMSREVEKLKPLLTLQYAAYKELNGAAIAIFDILSRLQNNAYEPNLGDTADQKMTEASGCLFFMPDYYKERWIYFQYQSRFVKEHANKLVEVLSQGKKFYNLAIEDASGKSTDEITVNNQKELWIKLHPKLFATLEELRKQTPH